eukprot:6384942-Alexandrium_andersonii.AAC.1
MCTWVLGGSAPCPELRNAGLPHVTGTRARQARHRYRAVVLFTSLWASVEDIVSLRLVWPDT